PPCSGNRRGRRVTRGGRGWWRRGRVRAARRRVGERRGATGVASHTTHIRSDVTAGLVNAVVSVPDGLASAALAGVNPVYGLYTSIGAPIAATPLLGSELMQVATTSASAIAV